MTKKNTNNNVAVKSAMAVVAVLAISGASYFGFMAGTEKVAANPDYICVKSVTNEPCQINRCDSWTQSGTRTCYGTKTTKVAYHHRRTSCEAGYTNMWAFANTGWASWRHTADYPYETTTCSIIETDRIDPTGGIDVSVN